MEYLLTYNHAPLPLIDISDEDQKCIYCLARGFDAHAEYEFDFEPWCRNCFRGADRETHKAPDRNPKEVAIKRSLPARQGVL